MEINFILHVQPGVNSTECICYLAHALVMTHFFFLDYLTHIENTIAYNDYKNTHNHQNH